MRSPFNIIVLVPFVTGVTLCHTKDGKTIIDPLSLACSADKITDLLSSLLRKSNSKLPPSYALPSSSDTVTDNFLILPSIILL